MITNTSLTVYHKTLNSQTNLEQWTKHVYSNVWWFSNRGSYINQGYTDSDNVQIRIPYNRDTINISDFDIGDILVQGSLAEDIETQQDLDNYEVYNITSITNNTYGNNPHLHIGGK